MAIKGSVPAILEAWLLPCLIGLVCASTSAASLPISTEASSIRAGEALFNQH